MAEQEFCFHFFHLDDKASFSDAKRDNQEVSIFASLFAIFISYIIILLLGMSIQCLGI